MNKTVKILLIVLCVVCVGVFCYSGYQLFSTLNAYKVAQRSYEELSNEYVSTEAPTATDSPVTENDDADDENKEKSPITVDFEKLLATNSDVCGWIYSADTVINYPIAQGEDNNEYLHHLLDGTYNSSGTLFLDCECAPEFAGANTIIYGHNMKDGSMFNSLTSYKEQSYYDEHPVMYINTPTQDYKLEIFSAYICNYDSDTYTLTFASESEYGDYLEKMKSQSDFTSDVEVTTNDRIVTLSTCTYEYDNARFVVQAKLVPLEA